MSLAGDVPVSFKDRCVPVIGGAGFIGSAVIWGLNQRGCHDVVVIDRLGHSEK
ncbi:MAG: NAD-dependent epimerase/dehydratase family protein [Nitrospira sp.]|nr:NAD-dependent epimerase/dehydratase family protein [Nitrospira sp.]